MYLGFWKRWHKAGVSGFFMTVQTTSGVHDVARLQWFQGLSWQVAGLAFIGAGVALLMLISPASAATPDFVMNTLESPTQTQSAVEALSPTPESLPLSLPVALQRRVQQHAKADVLEVYKTENRF